MDLLHAPSVSSVPPQDFHTIQSATGVDVVLRIAGPGARGFAFIVDWHIRTLIALAWYVLAAYSISGSLHLQAAQPSSLRFAIAVVCPAVIYFLYHPILELAMRGRTPGKRMGGVRLADRSGAAPGAGAVAIRNLFRLIDSFPFTYGIGLLTTMLTRDHVRIGDLAAGTLLVYDETSTLKSAPARPVSVARGKTDVAAASRLIDDYRLLARELATARRLAPASAGRAYLEAAYAETHARIYRRKQNPWQDLTPMLREHLPDAVRWLAPYIAWIALLFVCALLAGYELVRAYPELIALFASPSLIATVERGELWTHDLLNVVPSSILSVQILTNNIVVSVFAFCAGFLFGLGTFYLVALNGLMLGAIFAFTGQHGLDADLFSFVVAHGCVEISCLVLSGAAGAAVGNALIRPGSLTRGAAFRVAASRGGLVLCVCVVLLIGTGLIEGYVSPRTGVPFAVRVAIGVGYWLFMIAVLRGWLFGRRRSTTR